MTGDWDEEGFSEISMENKEGQKILTFTSNRITALAILQSRWACFPYQVNVFSVSDFVFQMLHLNSELCSQNRTKPDTSRPLMRLSGVDFKVKDFW